MASERVLCWVRNEELRGHANVLPIWSATLLNNIIQKSRYQDVFEMKTVLQPWPCAEKPSCPTVTVMKLYALEINSGIFCWHKHAITMTKLLSLSDILWVPQLILHFWIFQITRDVTLARSEYVLQRAAAAEPKYQNWVSFCGDIIPSLEHLTHAFWCIIRFFWRNNLARVNRLGTLCMGLVLGQTKCVSLTLLTG